MMRLSTLGTFAVSIPIVALLAMQGCHCTAARVAPVPAQTPPPVFAPSRPAVTQEPLPLAHRTQGEREASVLAAMHKRVWARRASLPDIRRIASDVYPLICEAAQQAEVTPYLQAFARDNGLSLEQAREQWIAIEEADLLLEAGGNPDDISPAGASGVAQWMPNIAREQGLHIDFARSRQFTARIEALNWRIAWLTYLSRPDADQNLPSKPTLTPADFAALPALQQERETLREQRRQADDRFEPRKAVFAHARYLLRLYRKFPSKDWIFQAYHGGEWGAKKEIWFYLGQKPASYAEAIQSGNTGQRLTYEDVYFGITPHAHIPAFRYIYGRGDDHRHYWWKLRSAQEALALYHRDPTGFEQEWNRLSAGTPHGSRLVSRRAFPCRRRPERAAILTGQRAGSGHIRGKHACAPCAPRYSQCPMVRRLAAVCKRRVAAGSGSVQTRGRQNRLYGRRYDAHAPIQRPIKSIAPPETDPRSALPA